MIINNLYNGVLIKEGRQANKLRIISGYASSGFLYRVSQDFPNLEIELFIGMTQEGISYQNHHNFKVLCQEENISVYYQVKDVPTHIKLYEFSVDDEIQTYVGSANFSENGFMKQRELLSKISTDENDKLFEEIAQASLECTDPDIPNRIMMYEDCKEKELEPQFVGNKEKLTSVGNLRTDNHKPKSLTNGSKGLIYPEPQENNNANQVVDDTKPFFNRNFFNALRRRRDYHYYKKFSVNIMGISISTWQNTGINANFQNKKSVLLENQGLPFYKVFPENERFEIYADNGKLYQAELTGVNNNELNLIGKEFYDYIREHMNISEYRPINQEDIKRTGLATVKFERISKTTYIMEM